MKSSSKIIKNKSISNVSIEYIQKILDSDMLDVDKITAILNTDSDYGKLAKGLLSYQRKMNPSVTNLTGLVGATNNYGLYSRIMKVLNIKEYAKFKVMFDIVNLVFYTYRKEAYDEYKLHRFVVDWKWGDKQLIGYQYIVTMLCILCDKTTRKENIQHISFKKLLNTTKTGLEETAKLNISKYYDYRPQQ